VSVKDLSPHTIGAEVLGRAERVVHHAVDLAERAADSLPSVSMPSMTFPSVSLPSVSLPSMSLPSVTVPHRHARHSCWRWVAIGGAVAAVLVALSILRKRRGEVDELVTDVH
jgi:hypothetical protein